MESSHPIQIEISNLGKIKSTTLDFRPLTVIIGPNNSNKTYIAYSVYGLFYFIVNRSNINRFKPVVKQTNSNTFAIEINEKLITLISENITASVERFQSQMGAYFQDNSNKLFDKTRFEVTVSREEIRAAVLNLDGVRDEWFGKLEFTLADQNLFVTVDPTDPTELSAAAAPLMLNQVVFAAYFNVLNSLFPEPFVLPAERNSLIITYKLLANRRYKQMRDYQREAFNPSGRLKQRDLLVEQGDLQYPQPVEDFLDFLIDLPDVSVEAYMGIPRENPFRSEIALIEKSIQTGNRTLLTRTKLGGREIKVNLLKGLDIDLYNASSSIKQLAPLILFLRYRAHRNNLIVIDEPEMNLHPESQAKLLEILVILINAGMKVLLTTHSPYILSHLNNLISANGEDQKVLSRQAKKLFLKDKRAFIDPAKVSAYEMRDNKLVDLKDENYGIRWDSLSEVSAEVQQTYFDINHLSSSKNNGKKKGRKG